MDKVSDVKDLSGMSEAVLAQAIEDCVQQVHLDNSQIAGAPRQLSDSHRSPQGRGYTGM